RIRPRAIVERVLVDDAKRSAVGVEVVDAKTRRKQVLHARAVVLCASTLETTRILLNSHPDGLGNASGVLGRYLMEHPSRVCWGWAKGTRGPNHRFGGPHSIYLPRFRNVDRLDAPFLRAYSVWGAIERQIVATETDEPQFMLAACMEMLPRV